MLLRTWMFAAIIGAGLVACSSTTVTGAGPDGGTTPNGSNDAGTTTASLSCVGVLQCAANCPDTNGDACVQACIDQSRGGSRDLATALNQCITDHACTDPTCLNASCKGELDACLADVPDQGTPSTGTTTPTGSIPAALVGTWSSIGLSNGTVWTFEADGQTTSAFDYETSLGSCTNKTTLATSGVTTASTDTFVYHRTSCTQVLKSCTSTSSKELGAAELTYRYSIGTSDDGTPKLSIDIVGADGTTSGTPTELHR